MLRKLLILLTFSFLAGGAIAQPASDDQNTKLVKSYCPEPWQLAKNGLWWGVGDWRSYGQSFVEKISQFAGAQWVGVGVGTMICVYSGAQTNDFPVTLHNTKALVKAPSGGVWGAYTDGRKNCMEGVSSIRDCPFDVIVKQEPKNVYQQLDFFKDGKYIPTPPPKIDY